MRPIKAFLAGMVLPGIIVPLVIGSLVLFDQTTYLESFPIYLSPLVWGLWNLLFIYIAKRYPIKNKFVKTGVHGAILGLICALFYSFVVDFPTVLQVSDEYAWQALVGITVVYYLIWHYFIGGTNELLEVY